MRAVFDTSVLVSALLLSSSKPRRALERSLQSGKILLSFPVLAELSDVLNRKQFHRYVDEEDVRDFIATLTREAEWIEPTIRINACRDPKDGKILELAIAGRATHIITGDADLLTLHPFQGVAIVTARDFLASRWFCPKPRKSASISTSKPVADTIPARFTVEFQV